MMSGKITSFTNQFINGRCEEVLKDFANRRQEAAEKAAKEASNIPGNNGKEYLS